MNFLSQPLMKIKSALIVVSFLCLVLSSFQCGFRNNLSQINQDDKFMDTLLLIHDTLLISVPKEYTINKGVGDDSEFVQIINESGSIVIINESEVGFMEHNSNTNNLEDVKASYNELNRIKKVNGKFIWVAYNSTKSKFRDIKGKAFFEYNDSMKEILKLECNSKDIDVVSRIISSIRSIN